MMNSGGRSVAYPISLRRKDRDEEIAFLVDTMQTATTWKQRLSQAITERCKVVQEAQKVIYSDMCAFCGQLLNLLRPVRATPVYPAILPCWYMFFNR